MATKKTTPKKATTKKPSFVKRVVDKMTKSKDEKAKDGTTLSAELTPSQKLKEYSNGSLTITKEKLLEFGFKESDLPSWNSAKVLENAICIRNKNGYEIIK